MLGFVAGCGGDGRLATAPVTGNITFDGKPLANAEIWLVPKSCTALLWEGERYGKRVVVWGGKTEPGRPI
jgi:hypothetical protein